MIHVKYGTYFSKRANGQIFKKVSGRNKVHLSPYINTYHTTTNEIKQENTIELRCLFFIKLKHLSCYQFHPQTCENNIE